MQSGNTAITQMIERVKKLEQEKIRKINQPVSITELMVKYKINNNDEYGEMVSKLGSCERVVPRLCQHINILAAIVEKHHREQYFANDQIKPDAVNKITRLTVPEFVFYTKDKPLSEKEFSTLQVYINIMAKRLHMNVHLVLGTFAVAYTPEKFQNVALYIQGGARPKVYSFAKNHTAMLDKTYNGYELVLMSELPENNTDRAQIGKIYLAEDGAYVICNKHGKILMGSLDKADFDLSDLTDIIKNSVLNSNLKNCILEIDAIKSHIIFDIYQCPGRKVDDGSTGCDLLLTSKSQLASTVSELKNSSYILAPEGLYYIKKDCNKPLSEEHLITNSVQAVKNLWLLLGGSCTPRDCQFRPMSNIQQNDITKNTDHNHHDEAENIVAGLQSEGQPAINYNSIFIFETEGGAQILVGNNICFDHEIAHSLKALKTQLERIKTSEDFHAYYPIQRSDVILSSTITHKPKKSMSYMVMHANASRSAYGVKAGEEQKKPLSFNQNKIEKYSLESKCKNTNISLTEKNIVVKSPPFGEDYIVFVYEEYSLATDENIRFKDIDRLIHDVNNIMMRRRIQSVLVGNMYADARFFASLQREEKPKSSENENNEDISICNKMASGKCGVM